jgi:hypothetical protein
MLEQKERIEDPFHRSRLRAYRIVPWWVNEDCIQVTVCRTERGIELGQPAPR